MCVNIDHILTHSEALCIKNTVAVSDVKNIICMQEPIQICCIEFYWLTVIIKTILEIIPTY